ncbi:tail fiber protein [Muricauda sp. SCSIO 64092]|uniref:tail fiber protein n=1 Tax=Allomuricauda sp. SCSIO 64092 TaxID=2908842 RepID=UPI001FF2642D|nr:tail fiber protein [Muricauda sp. SCSIO 64092]UOY08369.1 tail fiber protein [Muricauda sp. SCSIO 64092]
MANLLKYFSVLLWFNLPLVSLGQTNTFPTTGNVGIGTTTPNALFQIIQNNNQFSIRPESNQSGTLISSGQAINLVFNDNNVGTDFFSIRANGTTFSTSDELLRIIANGNVGIGTSLPASKLHIKSGGQQIIFGTGSNSSGYNFSLGVNDDGINFSNNSNYRGFNFDNNRGQLLKITHLGNVGIGTTNPDAKLTVKGNIHAEEVKVDLNVPAPDYVFKEDYELKSLQQVQDYIKEHGHLPSIPSAREMEEDGIELGAMDMKLLEKIEELTLYTIHQEEKLTEKEMQVMLLRDELKALKGRLSTIEKYILEK